MTKSGGVDGERCISAQANGPSGAADHQQEESRIHIDAITVTGSQRAPHGSTANQDVEPALIAAGGFVLVGRNCRTAREHKRRARIFGAELVDLGIDQRTNTLSRCCLGKPEEH